MNYPASVLALCLVTSTQCLKDTQTCSGYDCLKAYVDRTEPAYKWADLGHRLEVDDFEGRGGWTGYVLNFTSQQWLNPDLVDKSEWWHIMLVIVPHNVLVKDIGMLWITGGSNNIDDDGHVNMADEEVLLLSDVAVANKMVTAVLFHIPNQGIIFSEDVLQKNRKEDGIIAFTWWHFMNDGTLDAEYLLRLPMTKGAVKAMDTITNFLTSDDAPEELQELGLNPEKFFVGGASKRGWTTWTTGAVDPRVIGILPVVMDELNFVENIMHHYKSYGGWSFALEDYWVLNLTTYFDRPKMQDMCDIVDAFEHRDKLIMPKYVVNAANDEFFLPTDTQFWWEQMPYHYELNRFILLPNTEHSIVTGLLEIVPTVNAWISQILEADHILKEKYGGQRPSVETIEERNEASLELMSVTTIPRFNWTIDPESGDITVRSETTPVGIHVWQATTCTADRRDWRIANLDDPCTCGFIVPGEDLCSNLAVLWTSHPLEETTPGSLTWVAHKKPPLGGRYLAFYVSLSFNTTTIEREWPIGTTGVMDFSTTVSVVPNTFPYPECNGDECLGSLL